MPLFRAAMVWAARASLAASVLCFVVVATAESSPTLGDVAEECASMQECASMACTSDKAASLAEEDTDDIALMQAPLGAILFQVGRETHPEPGSANAASAEVAKSLGDRASRDGQDETPLVSLESSLVQMNGTSSLFINTFSEQVVRGSTVAVLVVLMLVASVLIPCAILWLAPNDSEGSDDAKLRNGCLSASEAARNRCLLLWNVAMGYQQVSPRPAAALLSSSEIAVAPRSMTAIVGVPNSSPDCSAPDPGLPPPLCSSLILPVCEARFSVSCRQLANVAGHGGVCDILGLSGSALLRTSVEDSPQGRFLRINMAHPGSKARAVVRPKGSSVFEVLGPNDAHYGNISRNSAVSHVLRRELDTILVIDGDPAGTKLTVQSEGGRPFAMVERHARHFSGEEHLEIRVHPGVDAVLALSCVLAVNILFLPALAG